MQFFPGISLAVTITNSSHGIPAPNVIFLILPRGTRLRTVAPNNMSGIDISSIYCARPVTLSRPSLRGTDLPTMCSDIMLSQSDSCTNRGAVTAITRAHNAFPRMFLPEKPVCREGKFSSPHQTASLPDMAKPRDDDAVGPPLR